LVQGPQVAGPPTVMVHLFLFEQSAFVVQVTLHAIAGASHA
jgi:hypothetical protein